MRLLTVATIFPQLSALTNFLSVLSLIPPGVGRCFQGVLPELELRYAR